MTSERLYNLLPAIYRQRDAELGEPLRALLGVIDKQYFALEDDIQGLYDNWFIETCSDWAAAYIGDLLGVRGIEAVAASGISPRPFVANTLAYRRRKGTVSVLQQLARDVTGGPAKAVEYFQLLETTQYVNHVRLFNVRTPDLRDTNQLELLGGPLENAAHTADVRHIASGRGKYNIPNVGIWLYRLQSFPLDRASARAVTQPPDPDPSWRFTFNQLGLDAPLFNSAATEASIVDVVQEINLPGPLRRRPLFDELVARRQALAAGAVPSAAYFGTDPVLEIFADGTLIAPEKVFICDLSQWRRPAASSPISVAVDPVLGRLAFAAANLPVKVQVSYSYGLNAAMGGGPYRRQSAIDAARATPDFRIGVSQLQAPVPNQIVATLAAAVELWNALPAGKSGIITVLDSGSYADDLAGADAIKIPHGSRLSVVAADEQRPHLSRGIAITGTAAGTDAADAGTITFDGLLIEGAMVVNAGNLAGITISHCTLAPATSSLTVNQTATPDGHNSRLRITVDHSILGPVRVSAPAPGISLVDSIVDAGGSAAIAATATDVALERTTVLGSVGAGTVEASNSIFTAPLVAQRRQTGCVRFSYLADGSKTPRAFHCQPQLALTNITDPAQIAAIKGRIQPGFTSERYGDPGYCQIARNTADEIRTGADDRSEMGAFCSLKAPQREANLINSLNEYLRFGLEAGIFYST
jgi:hypothetical protein